MLVCSAERTLSRCQYRRATPRGLSFWCRPRLRPIGLNLPSFVDMSDDVAAQDQERTAKPRAIKQKKKAKRAKNRTLPKGTATGKVGDRREKGYPSDSLEQVLPLG